MDDGIFLLVKRAAIIILVLFFFVPNPTKAEVTITAPTIGEPTSVDSQAPDSPPVGDTASQSDKPPKEEQPLPESAPSQTTSMAMSAGGSGDGGAENSTNLPKVTNSDFIGSASIAIPIEVPSGRGGIAPNLNLTYRNIQNNNWLGVGWNLDMGAIQRGTKFGVVYPPSLPGTDFVAITKGVTSELVPRSDWGANYFGAKIEGQFSKYFYNSSTKGWEVTAKDGTKYYYGSSLSSRQDNGSDSTIFKWCLDKVQDMNGNYMTVSYVKDNSEIYLDRIDYTGNINTPVLSPANYVKFWRDNGSRPDAPDMYGPTYRVQTRYRLKTIEIRGNGSLARAYKLNYIINNGMTTNRSILQTVQQYGSDAVVNGSGDITAGTSLTIFSGGYDSGGTNPGLVEPQYNSPALGAGVGGYNPSTHETGTFYNGDFNGDGITDIMVSPLGGDNRWLIAYGKPTGGFTTPDYNQPALDGAIAGGWSTTIGEDTNAAKIGDFNGDGKMDYMWVPSNGDGRWLIAYGTLSGFIAPDYNNPVLFAAITGGYSTINSATYGVYMLTGDYNGDGKTDFMWRPSNGDGRWLIAYTNTAGTGFNIPAYTSPALPAVIGYDPNSYFCYYGFCSYSVLYYSYSEPVPVYQRADDFNGDGKTDFMWVPKGGDGRWLIAYANAAGTGFNIPDYNSPALPATITGGYPTSSLGCQFGDFNGDGKTDYMWKTGDGRWLVAYATGTGTGLTIPNYNYPALPATITGGYWTYDFEYPYTSLMTTGDFNGDGKTDFMWRPINGDGRVLIAYSTGSGFILPAYSNPALPATLSGVYSSRSWGNQLLISDFNGDGKADYMWIPPNGDGRWLLARANIPDHLPDVLTSASNAIGGSYTIDYTPSTHFMNVQLPFPVQVVTSIRANDGNGNNAPVLYDYEGGLYDISQRDFRGFGYVAQTNPDQSVVERTYHQDSIKKGLLSEQATGDAAGNPYTITTNSYEETSPYPGCNFPYLHSTETHLHDGVQNYKSFMTDFGYDAYGNMTSKYSYGDTSISGDEKDATTTYSYDTSHWIVSLPVYTWVFDSGNFTRLTYYDYYAGTVNLHAKTDWFSDGANPVTSYTYDAYGNMQTMTDPKMNMTTFTYDATKTYLASTTNNFFNFTTSKTYDYRYGKPLTETDFNNNTTTYKYDVFGRLSQVIKPYDNVSYPTQTISYDYFGQGIGTQRVKTQSREQSNTLNTIWQETYFDGLGRTIAMKKEGPDAKVIVTETIYNQMGQVNHSSLPYFQGLETPHWISTSYDPVGRVTQVANPDATTTISSYMQGTTTIVDANGHKKEEDRDVYGRLIHVREYTGLNPNFTLYATTNYAYDALDNLVQVTDNDSNITTIHYDTLGRKDWMDDPDMGHWEYGYDANGNLTSQTDEKNQTITFQYDALNRLTLKNYPTGADIIYTYDESFTSNSLGRLTTVSDATGMTKFYYDMRGRSWKTIKTIAGVNYTTQTSYDAMDRITSIAYPGGAEIVGYGYNTGGNLWHVGNYATYYNYNARGQVGTITHGNGTATSYFYYPYNARLYALFTTSQGQLRQYLEYFYDDTGNIRIITDHLNATRSQTFTYDELNRLITAQSGVYGTISYDYDEIGNMIFNSQVGTFTYPINHIKPHAVSMAGMSSYQYDDNGNMTNKGGVNITYDYDNRPTNIGSNVNAYDYSGQRVIKNNTIYIGQLYECTGSVCTKYIFAGGNRIAMKRGSMVNYYHTDHLKSSSIITNSSGATVEEIYYYPYGATRSDTGSVVKHKYTGQEEDAEVGLYYYNARYYDPNIGRFISADTIVPSPGNPQSLNRYSYVMNNPLRYIDPSGHSLWSFLVELFGGGGPPAVPPTTNPLGDLPRGFTGRNSNAHQGSGIFGSASHHQRNEAAGWSTGFWVSTGAGTEGGRTVATSVVIAGALRSEEESTGRKSEQSYFTKYSNPGLQLHKGDLSGLVPDVDIGIDSPVGGVVTTLPFGSGGDIITEKTTPSYNYSWPGTGINVKYDLTVTNTLAPTVTISTPFSGLQVTGNVSGAIGATFQGPQFNFPFGSGANGYVGFSWNVLSKYS